MTALDSLRRPTSYKSDLERLEVRATHLARRVEALEQERDALKHRLATANAEIDRLKRATPPRAQRQAQLEA